MEWRQINDDVPTERVLLWTGAGYAIGILVVDRSSDSGHRHFMEIWNDSLLPSPTHWMPLPDPPAEVSDRSR
jgi:hypothetical protein